MNDSGRFPGFCRMMTMFHRLIYKKSYRFQVNSQNEFEIILCNKIIVLHSLKYYIQLSFSKSIKRSD